MESLSARAAPTQVDSVELALKFPRLLCPGEATTLRGFFGGAFADEVIVHHHEANGGLRYAYPKVQFKVLDRIAHVVGLSEGANLVTRIWTEVDQAQIAVEVLPILEAYLTRRSEPLGETESPVFYEFRTPWLGLNQENHARYQQQSSQDERRVLLERTLVGNCLSLAKGFGHWVRARVTADCSGLRPVPAGLKGVAMTGFVGTFRVNFQIPEHCGIGKSVSRGFGTVERVTCTPSRFERRRPCSSKT
jgi:hypothetical protein